MEPLTVGEAPSVFSGLCARYSRDRLGFYAEIQTTVLLGQFVISSYRKVIHIFTLFYSIIGDF